MFVLMAEPDWFDLEGWWKHLDWLRTTPEAIPARDEQIASAMRMIGILEGAPPSPQRRTEAA